MKPFLFMRSKLFGLSYLLAFVAFMVLCLRLGYPYYRLWAVIIYAISVGIFIYALRRKTTIVSRSKAALSSLLSGKLLKILYGVAAFAFAYLLWVLVPLETSPLTKLSEEELHQHIADDLQTVLMLNENLKSAYQELSKSALFTKDISTIQPDELEAVKVHWADFVKSTFEFDILKEKYKGFLQIGDPELHAKSFALAYGAYVAQYRGILFLSQLVDNNAYFESVLNEADTTRGIPANTYYQLNQHTTHLHTLLRFHAGRNYYELIEEDIAGYDDAKQELGSAVEHVQTALLNEPYRFVDNPLDFFEKSAFKAWIPLQKSVALTLADIRLTNRDNLIDRETIQKHREKFSPGDILLERRNWYATNIGIPGFWPHAAFYIGDLKTMDTYFSDIKLPDGKSPSELILQEYPEVYAVMQKPDAAGDNYCILEAIKPGVVLNTLEESAHADALCVLRPRVTKEQKFEAILKAMAHYGKPYDYDFEFATDNALVCSEVIYKAYDGADGMTLETIIMNGRNLLPPNRIAQKFDEEYGSPEQQLDLVLFLDSDEARNTAVEGKLEDFRESWKRPKWYILANTLQRP
ncbi:YiiX/YebB-like N1pC/P60 family cysteine hydrolase [Rubellicoccus peritrichatus]|uniref:YiiX/YebB-like N1pC/P60 family cysteine hydrolase n=1 Tax=Rubellicoccus peritrichatus TaxID=3080537 RepID=A0AAQ3QPP0_9BACT|nr:YiiX/YebB-like N1pC/P60 family cysteine hydrolase [Puniceicoccus sp. CR14]WOO39263.1 YiiX/YebB-like N1pC/P60 family cysteine hydrolase [Puniceicoccus sp. CR14]